MLKTCASMFSGCGGWEGGAVRQGLTPLWGVEIDPKIAAIWDENFGKAGAKCIVSDVRNVNYSKLPRPDVLFASPECSSIAAPRKAGSKAPRPEVVCDFNLGFAIVRALAALRPQVFLLEEVTQFEGTAAWKTVSAQLAGLGYGNFEVIKTPMTVFGVPQVRVRLIARATDGGALPPLAPPVYGKGWWETVQPLVDAGALPKDELAPWQARGLRLKPPSGWPVYVPAGDKRGLVYDPDEGREVPWAWYAADEVDSEGRPRALPSLKTAKSGGAGRIMVGPKGPVYRITTQAYAILQGFFPEHKFPTFSDADTTQLVYDVIGRAVPPKASFHLLAPFMAR